MPIHAIRGGLTQQFHWRDMDAPELSAFSFATSLPTQLSNPTGTNVARFYEDPSGLTFFKYRFVFDANTTYPSGDDVVGVRLPFPANRASGGADLVGGASQVWAGSSASPQWSVPLRPSLMDPMGFGPYGSKNGMEDYYIQFFVPYVVGRGTGTIASGSTSTTITHGLGTTPQAEDITIRATANTTNAIGIYYLTSLTSTQFTLNTHSSPGAGGLAFSWKARVEPTGAATLDVLANHARPFAWASGTEFSGFFCYEAQI